MSRFEAVKVADYGWCIRDDVKHEEVRDANGATITFELGHNAMRMARIMNEREPK